MGHPLNSTQRQQATVRACAILQQYNSTTVPQDSTSLWPTNQSALEVMREDEKKKT